MLEIVGPQATRPAASARGRARRRSRMRVRRLARSCWRSKAGSGRRLTWEGGRRSFSLSLKEEGMSRTFLAALAIGVLVGCGPAVRAAGDETGATVGDKKITRPQPKEEVRAKLSELATQR